MSRFNGFIIRRARKEKEMTTKECADLCALSLETYEKIEAGELKPGHSEIVLLANAFGVSSEALERGELVYRKDLPDLSDLAEMLEERIAVLEQGIAELRTMIRETFSKDVKEPEFIEEKAENKEAAVAAEAPVAAIVPENEPERSVEVCLVR